MCGRPAKFGGVDIWLDCATLSGSAYAQLSARSAASAYAQLSRAQCNVRNKSFRSRLHERSGRPGSAVGSRGSMTGHLRVAVQLGVRAGGSHGPVVNSWRRAWSLVMPHLVAVSR